LEFIDRCTHASGYDRVPLRPEANTWLRENREDGKKDNPSGKIKLDHDHFGELLGDYYRLRGA